MKRLTSLLLAGLAAGPFGCIPAAAVRPEAAPLDDDTGLLAVHLEAEGAEGRRLSLEVATLAAVRSDGQREPLVLERSGELELGTGRRLLAQARIEPGAFVALELRIARGRLASADLLVPPEDLRVEVPFAVAGGRGTLVVLRLDVAASLRDGYALEPRLAAEVPAKTVTSLLALASLPSEHHLTGFDTQLHRVTAILPTGRTPYAVAIDPLRELAFVTLTGADEVQVIDLANFATVARVRLSPGDEPRGAALTPDRSQLVVAARGSGSLVVVDTLRFVESGRVRLEPRPERLVLDFAGRRAYVAHPSENLVSIVDLATRSVVPVRTEDQPLLPQLDRAGAQLFVAHAGSAHIRVLATADQTERRRLLAGLGTTAIRVDPVTGLLYAANGLTGTIAIFDPVAPDPVGRIDAGGAATELLLEPERNLLYAVSSERGVVRVIDLGSRRTVAEVDVGAGPALLALPGGRE